MMTTVPGGIAERIEKLVLEYAQNVPPALPLAPTLSLRDDLAIESLSLVALTVRLGEEFGVNLEERGVDLGRLERISDLIALATTPASHSKPGIAVPPTPSA